MGLTHFRRGLPLLAVLLTACATSTPVVHEGDEPSEAVSSWEEARADPSCVVPLCDEERCAIWRCRDVVEVEAPRAVDARFHQWLHSGGPDGGQWNEAWRQFQRENGRATAEQMWAFAGELMSRFGVNGPLMPYYCD
ncbi:DUF2380 domain-containing protein [Archangium sp.]|uniref:DUF2380 domain-containing protein n=1 Tax=Archangium sp. TaxID=1872627 RepID=UPI00286D369A|nr:DUF2380 domain-containing protein [Archangium sp.]